jgi:uncharacterized protein YcbK (DUF882 family)
MYRGDTFYHRFLQAPLFSSSLPSLLWGRWEKSECFRFTTHTNEHIEGICKKGEDYNPQALEKINCMFQDHHADKIHTIDPALLDYRYDLLLKVACP